MLKKTITYTDYNGVERTEDFYFNLTKQEIMTMEFSTKGGLTELINKVVATQDSPAIVKIFQDLILASYGEKSLDGKRFMKMKPDGSRYADEFRETEAYSILFMELATDADAAAKFVNGIVPAEAANAANNAETAAFLSTK